MIRRTAFPVFALVTAFAATVWAESPAPVDFGRDVRPLLAEKCFTCHGLDAAKRETNLRLDTKEGLFAELESGDGVAIVPGNADKSVVYRRLVHEDAEQRMPPAEGKPLTDAEIATIKRWIDEGAVWQEHWSFVAPTRPELPEVQDVVWPRNAIDRFVLKQLEGRQLAPSPQADAVTLLRRVTYDLTGLPPTLAEVDRFLTEARDGKTVAELTAAELTAAEANGTPFPRLDQAYEAAVERLLSSPRYGEHMARYWLDAARYGDTHGLHLDNFREIWPYRDWVVRAFNQNKPFDQFTIEQLAGDLLPNPTRDQLIATGFNRCNVTTSEGGVIPEEYYVHYTNDRVSTMSTVWMGVSMGCVTCHEHKFDPFEMKDFYQLFAFFNSLDGPVMDGNKKDTAPVLRVASDQQQAELDELAGRIAELIKSMEAPQEQVDQAQQAWEADTLRGLESQPQWAVLAAASLNSPGGAKLEQLEDRSVLASGDNPDKEVYTLEAELESGDLTALRLEVLLHDSFGGRAGRSSNGNAVLSEFEAEVATADSPDSPDKWQPLKFSKAWADYEQPDGNFKIANAIDGQPGTGWAIAGHQKKEPREAIFVAEKPFGAKGSRLRIRLRHESIYGQHQFGRFRLSVTSAEQLPAIGATSVPAEIVNLLRTAPADRKPDQLAKIRDHFRQQVCDDEQLVKHRDELAARRRRRDELEKSLPTTLIWKEMATPKPAFILQRGAYDKPGEQVYRNTPAAFPPLPPLAEGEIANRLHLAKWLVSPAHPLTARVTVNRIWQQYFGVGIVETSEDFGSQGTPPSHPALLDWLAVEFRESGWDVKQLHKSIVMSATYRQSSRLTPELAKADPRNRWLARGPRFRMDAEMIRDTALAISGLLVPDLGGPSVKPYQPEGIWEAVGYTDSDTAKFSRDAGQGLYRRTLYSFWKRTAPPPTLVTLDAPSRESCTVRRSRTNTPLAALALMNDEQFVEASRGLGQRILREGGADDESRAKFAFRLATAREPGETELGVLLKVYRESLEKFRSEPESAAKLNAVGESKPDSELDACELAAWSMVGNLVLNLDETLTK